MATTALDETLQRDRTAELSALPTPLTRGGKSEASRRSDIFERSPAAAGAARPALPTVEYARVSDELERRSREWTAMVRLLEQNRHTLDCAEMERDAAYDELARIVPIVQETAKELTAAMDASRSGRPSPDLPELFAKNSEFSISSRRSRSRSAAISCAAARPGSNMPAASRTRSGCAARPRADGGARSGARQSPQRTRLIVVMVPSGSSPLSWRSLAIEPAR